MSLVAHIDPEYHHERKPYFGKLMEEKGFEVDGIGDVGSAVDAMTKGHIYDIIVMDLMQFSRADSKETAPSYHSGLGLIEAIHGDYSLNRETPILVHCPRPPNEYYVKMVYLGVNEYLRKITHPDIVIAKMQELIAARSDPSDFAGDVI